MVSPKPRYTAFQWFWVTCMGVSMQPLELSYRCRVCGVTFDSTTDPAALEAYMGAG